MFKRLVIVALTAALIIPVIPSYGQAAENETIMKNVFVDAAYGGAVGALIGLGFMLLREEPEDHWNYVAFGAGGGIIAGAAVGMASSTKALAEIEGGKVSLNLPEIKTNIVKDEYGDKLAEERTVYLVRYNF